jgi:hypothetical protein
MAPSAPVSAFSKFAKSVPKFIEEHNKELVVKITDVLKLSESDVAKVVEAIKVEEVKTGGRKGGKSSTTRAPTEYNLFVQTKIKEIRGGDSTMDRKELMVQAAAAWTLQKAARKAAAEAAEAAEAAGTAEVAEVAGTAEAAEAKPKKSKKADKA